MESFFSCRSEEDGDGRLGQEYGEPNSDDYSTDESSVSAESWGEGATGVRNSMNSLCSVGKSIESDKNGLRFGVTNVGYPADPWDWELLSSLHCLQCDLCV